VETIEWSGEAKSLLASDGQVPHRLRSGRETSLVFTMQGMRKRYDLWVLPLAEDGIRAASDPVRILPLESSGAAARFSPDGAGLLTGQPSRGGHRSTFALFPVREASGRYPQITVTTLAGE